VTYDEGRFKKAFRVSRNIWLRFKVYSTPADIEKNTVTEIPVSPECRLAICIYKQRIHFPEQLVQCHRLQQLQTRQATTCASVCFPPHCIFVLLSNRTFNSDTNTFPQVMHEYFVFLLQIVQAEGNVFLHEDITRAMKTYEVGKAPTVCACDINETNRGLIIIMCAFNSMRLLCDV